LNVFRTFDVTLRRNLLILFTAGLLFWSSLALLLPTLPLYIDEAVGANKQQIGIIIGSFAFGMLIFRPMLGRLADERGRKLVLLIGTAVVAIAPLGYLFVKSIPMLMLLRAFHGISIAAFGTAFMALVADLAPERQRGEVIGYMSLVNPIGVAIGPALGGYLQASAGYTPLFLVSAGFGLVALLFMLQIVNPPINDLQPKNIPKNQFWQMLISPRVRVPMIVLSLVGLALGAVHSFLPLFIKSTGVDLNVGLFFTAAAIASFSVRVFTGRASDKYGRGLFITLSLICYAVAIIMIWKANNTFVFLLAGFIEGAGSGTVIPMIAAMMTDRALPNERGRIFGVSLMGFDVGIAIAGPVFGAIAEKIGYRDMFGVVAGFSFLAILVFLTQSGKNLSNSFRFAIGRAQDAYSLNKL
jgi:MFS family permease